MLIACGPDPQPDLPAQHGCFDSIKAPATPEPLIAQLIGTDGPAQFLGDVEPGQEVVLNPVNATEIATLKLVGPIVSNAELGPVQLTLTPSDGSFSFTAPMGAGSYRLKTAEKADRVVVGEIEVVAAPVAICNSTDVGLNGEVVLVWTGPGDEGDKVDLFDPVTGRILQTAPAGGSHRKVNTTVFIAPDEVGQYAVRYRKADGLIQVSNDIAVTRARELGTLRVRSNAQPGDAIIVQWIGPLRPGHVIRIVDSTSGDEVVATALVDGGFGAGSARLEAPGPGEYRVEYGKPGSGLPAASADLNVVSGDG